MNLNNSEPKAILLLEDGTIFYGKPAGKIGTTTGELCFNTGMTGYQEIFTDPSYFGQIMVMTNVHIGNYGAKESDTESVAPKISGLVCKDFAHEYSRPVADGSLQSYLESNNVVAIYDIDSRKLVRHIRTKGAMNGVISSDGKSIEELKNILKNTPSMEGLELSSKVTTEEPYYFGNEEATYRIAVLDYGVKRSILQCFADRDCYLRVFPAHSSFEDVSEWNPDGYFLSNGPGDPAAMDYAVAEIRKILKSGAPVFGICLGHQLLGRSMGIPTYKMHHGHRGINHPVRNETTGKGEITSQNHGFGIKAEDMKAHLAEVEITHINLNDNTVEGLRVKEKPAFSVQYHPEASPGPHDARYLFDDFIDLL